MVKEQLQEIFRDIFDDKSIEIFDEMTAKDLEDWDSLMHMNLIVAMEEEFSIKFTMTEMLDVKKVGDFIALIEQKRG